jgi:hypothetical protein
MARPRIFISSTYYDLKHLRSSLENFIDSLGFDPILSEKGRIAYTPDIPLDESCYREVGTADIFVMIVGGRYGSEVSASKTVTMKTFYDRYNSVTRGEYRSAVERNVPIYILIERSVYAEYETFLKNQQNSSIKYAHVDSVNVFELIADILAQPRNNPVQQFDRYSDVEMWLREQWSGLFRELLQRIQGQAQISSLQAQVAQLAEINTTLKTYLEEIVSRVAPQESKSLITNEQKRLEEARVLRILQRNGFFDYLTTTRAFRPEMVFRAIEAGNSLEDFLARLVAEDPTFSETASHLIDDLVQGDLNDLRTIVGLPPVPTFNPEKQQEHSNRKIARSRKAKTSTKKATEG